MSVQTLPAAPPAGPVLGATQIDVRHDTRYVYAMPVSQSHHVAYLTPVGDTHQQVLAHQIEVQPQPMALNHRTDAHGNRCVHLALTQPHRELQVTVTARVAVSPRFNGLRSALSPAWEALRDRLRYVAGAVFDPAVVYAQPSPLVPRLEVLRAYAAPIFTAHRPVAEAAVDLMQRVHRDFEYRSEATQVDTPLAQAFSQRSGVCQDFAQVMIGACRMMGVPARYVSGYLLTHAAAGGQKMVGADATHAWVQVYAPGTPGVPADGWLDLDPTNNRVAGVEHIRLAVGRDFADVTPLRGVVRGGGRHTLAVGVTTELADIGTPRPIRSSLSPTQHQKAGSP
jgi:transglutaminase-like putative cysteine protease